MFQCAALQAGATAGVVCSLSQPSSEMPFTVRRAHRSPHLQKRAQRAPQTLTVRESQPKPLATWVLPVCCRPGSPHRHVVQQRIGLSAGTHHACADLGQTPGRASVQTMYRRMVLSAVLDIGSFGLTILPGASLPQLYPARCPSRRLCCPGGNSAARRRKECKEAGRFEGQFGDVSTTSHSGHLWEGCLHCTALLTTLVPPTRV